MADLLPNLLNGLRVTLLLTIAALGLGLPFGVLLAVMAGTRLRQIRYATIGIVEFGRGTPVLVLLYLAYYGAPQIGIYSSAFATAVGALAYSTGAYTSEMFRGALQSVPKGQREAGLAMGLSRTIVFFRILLPQAIRVAIPPVLSHSIIVFHLTALCFAISVPELLSRSYAHASITFEYGRALGLAALLYSAVALLASSAVGRLERRLEMSFKPVR